MKDSRSRIAAASPDEWDVTLRARFGEPTYDDEEEARLIQERTGAPLADVEKFMMAQNLYAYGFGLIADDPDDLEVWGTTKEALRARHPALIPANKIAARELPADLERRFIAAEAGLAEHEVRAMQAAEREYQIRAGILVQVID